MNEAEKYWNQTPKLSKLPNDSFLTPIERIQIFLLIDEYLDGEFQRDLTDILVNKMGEAEDLREEIFNIVTNHVYPNILL